MNLINWTVIGDCRALVFDTTTEGSALIGHVVTSYVVKSQGDCDATWRTSACWSTLVLGTTEHIFDLTGSDYGWHPKDFRHQQRFICISDWGKIKSQYIVETCCFSSVETVSPYFDEHLFFCLH